MQHVDVVDEVDEVGIGDDLSAERDDERPAAKGVDVGRRSAEPGHEFGHRADYKGARVRRFTRAGTVAVL